MIYSTRVRERKPAYVGFFIYGDRVMSLIREFKDTVYELGKSPAYRGVLLAEIAETYLGGDMATGNTLMVIYTALESRHPNSDNGISVIQCPSGKHEPTAER